MQGAPSAGSERLLSGRASVRGSDRHSGGVSANWQLSDRLSALSEQWGPRSTSGSAPQSALASHLQAHSSTSSEALSADTALPRRRFADSGGLPDLQLTPTEGQTGLSALAGRLSLRTAEANHPGLPTWEMPQGREVPGGAPGRELQGRSLAAAARCGAFMEESARVRWLCRQWLLVSRCSVCR